ncbi:gamma carbonic anhydrase family protein [Hahella ganghwensis]|uniref:gamma carbonic anhydrase family protein n=1 Tax=Hahella ganghwensis TaxID=286420 RepID=UPI00037A20A6|nr:gamma carbonic anhydrase family protein [Hahella ganghwensis]
MLYSLGDKRVRLEGEGHFIAPNASLVGEVVLQSRVSIWFGAVIRGDNDLITIGADSNVQDNAVLHTDPGIKLTVGNGVTIGHHCIIGANALIPENTIIPDGSLVVGSPAKVRRTLDDRQKAMLEAGGAHYVKNAVRFNELLKEQSID